MFRPSAFAKATADKAGQESRPAGFVLLWILAGLSILLLVYEAATLVNSVWRPLIANPQALQTDFHYYNDAAIRFSANRSRLYLATDDVIAGFAYPPPAIVPFMWLSKFPLGTALLAFTITSYLVLLGSLQHWIRFLRRNGLAVDRATNAMLLLIAVGLAPTYMNAVFGQVNAFVLASGVVFVTMASTAALEAGSVLAAGIWLKVYPVLLAAMAMWERRAWRGLLCAIGALITIVIVLLPIVPIESYAVFFFEVLPTRGDKTAIHITNQSLIAFFERFRYPSAQFLNWTGEQAVTVSALVRAINWAFAAASIAWLSLRARSGHYVAAGASLIALMAVVAPLGWGHTYVLVLPLVVLQLAGMRGASTPKAIVIFLSVLAMTVPAGRALPLERLPDGIQNVVYSRYLLATAALMIVPAAAATKNTKDDEAHEGHFGSHEELSSCS